MERIRMAQPTGKTRVRERLQTIMEETYPRLDETTKPKRGRKKNPIAEETQETTLPKTLGEGSGLGTHRVSASPVTADELIRLLEEFKGNITSMCRYLKCSRQTFYDYLKKFPKLKEALKDINEAELDTAEEKLNELIDKRNLTAIIFKLKCKGRHRGWIDRPEDAGGGKSNQLIVQIFPVTGGPPIVSNVKGGNAKYIDRDTPALLAHNDGVMDAEFFDGPGTPLEVNP
jgi:hypothetical protein